jgi:hypothetical protein
MAVMAVRGLIIQASKFIDINSFNSDLPIQVITFLMGLYLSSIVLMLKANLPLDYKSDMMDFGGVRWFLRWFDKCFLVSVVVSGIWHYHLQKSKAQYE